MDCGLFDIADDALATEGIEGIESLEEFVSFHPSIFFHRLSCSQRLGGAGASASYLKVKAA